MLIKNKCFFPAVFSVIIFSVVFAHAEDTAKAKPHKGSLNENTPAPGKFVYNAHEKRDPFIALVGQDGRILEPPARKSGNIEIEGIMYDPKGASYTVINTEIYKIGDTIGEYRILRIEREKVTFVKAGKEIEVELKKEE